MVELAFILNVMSGYSMLGVIFLVHLVHYPSFLYVYKDQFQRFHNFHSVEITKVVLPLMAIELITSLYFSIFQWNYLWSLNLLIVLGTWAVTFFWSVREHLKLEKSFDEFSFDSLMRSNLVRTFLWFLRSVLLSYLLWERI